MIQFSNVAWKHMLDLHCLQPTADVERLLEILEIAVCDVESKLSQPHVSGPAAEDWLLHEVKPLLTARKGPRLLLLALPNLNTRAGTVLLDFPLPDGWRKSGIKTEGVPIREGTVWRWEIVDQEGALMISGDAWDIGLGCHVVTGHETVTINLRITTS